MPRSFIIVRCPRCGSTDAGEVGGMFEFAEMRCASCGHLQYCDEYQIKDTWNVEIVLSDDAKALPANVAPLVPSPCERCGSAPRSFMIRPANSRNEDFVEITKLYSIRRCRSCFICYRFGFSAGGMVSDDEDEVDKLDMATSLALLSMAEGELTRQELAALSALPDFSWWRIEDAVSPQIDFTPILAVLRAELASQRQRMISWRLIASAARAGADVSEFVAPLIAELQAMHKEPGQYASEHTILLTDVVEACLERGLDLTAAIATARQVFTDKTWLREMRPRLAAICDPSDVSGSHAARD